MLTVGQRTRRSAVADRGAIYLAGYSLLHPAFASLSVFPSFGSAKVRFLFRLSSTRGKIFLFILPAA